VLSVLVSIGQRDSNFHFGLFLVLGNLLTVPLRRIPNLLIEMTFYLAHRMLMWSYEAPIC